MLGGSVKFGIDRENGGVALESEDHSGNRVGGGEREGNPLDLAGLLWHLPVELVDGRRQNALRTRHFKRRLRLVFPPVFLFKVLFLKTEVNRDPPAGYRIL